MSNKILIPVIIVLSLITIGVTSLKQFNKIPEKLALNSSLEIISSVKALVVSSSSVVQSSSSYMVVSSAQKLEEGSVKTESQTIISNSPKCNLPESENLVKTEDGCFEKIIWSPNEGLLPSDPNFEPIKKIENEILIDYFQKVKANFISDKKSVSIDIYKKINDSNYEVLISVYDLKLFKKLNPQLTNAGGPNNLFPYKYSINVGVNSKITYTATKSPSN